ncbi:MAG: hypothetical protein U1E26_04800 [Coriobacteriia bacterium]|nr:hypothetical protein [Coriobacteriia bacterium]
MESLHGGSTEQADVLEAALRRAGARRRLRLVPRLFLGVAVVWWAGSIIYESWSAAAVSDLVDRVTTAASIRPGDELLDLAVPESSSADPSSLLPMSVEGWTVQGVQPVPGARAGDLIEGSYLPSDEFRSLVTPLVVYVQTGITPLGSEDPISAVGPGTRYTEAVGESVIEGMPVALGATPDGWSYVVSWNFGERSYTADASFRFVVPEQNAREILKRSAEEIARAIVIKQTNGGLVP